MNNKSFTGLVLGCGDVGGRVARSWAANGHTVWGLRRGPELRDLGSVVSIRGELKAPESWIAAMPSSIDCVVFAASGGGGGESGYRETYVEGTRAALEALMSRDLRRVLWCSSTGVYGEFGGNWVDEESPADAQGWRGRLVREGELEVERWCGAHGIPLCIVRLGGIYGPGRLRMLDRIKRAGPAHKPAPGAPTQWTNRIHVRDAAGFLEHLSTLDVSRLPPRVNATDGNPVPKWELERLIAKELNLPVEPERGQTAPVISSPVGNKRCRNRLMMSLGYELKHPQWQLGYRELIRGHNGAGGSGSPPT